MVFFFDDIQSKLVQAGVIGFKMNDAAGFQKFPVPVQEKGRGEPFAFAVALRLRIWKSDPDFINFSGAEKIFDIINPAPDKSYVFQFHFLDHFASFPEPGAFDIHPYEIPLRIHNCQVYRIFAFSAAQFKSDRMVIMEIVTVPIIFQNKFRTEIRVRILE